MIMIIRYDEGGEGGAVAARAGEIITFDTSTVIEHRQLPTTPPLAPLSGITCRNTS